MVVSLAISLVLCFVWFPLVAFFGAIIKTPVPDVAAWLEFHRAVLLPEPAERYAYLSLLFLLSIIGGGLFVHRALRRNNVHGHQNSEYLLPLRPFGHVVIWLICVAIVIVGLHLFLYPDRYLYFLPCEHHFSIIQYPFVMQELGLPQINQYGAYFLFLRPWCLAFGTSHWSLLALFGSLQLASFTCILLTVVRWCREATWLPIMFVFAFLVSWPSTDCVQVYLQYHPIRTLFPMLMLFLWGEVLFSSSASRITFSRILIIVFAGISIIWNIDSGVPVVASSLVFLFTTNIFKRDYKRLAVECGLTCLLFFSSYVVAAYVLHNPYWLLSQLSFQKEFYLDGFAMLPMGNIFASGAAFVLLVEMAAFLYGCCQMGCSCKNTECECFKKGVYYICAAILSLGLFAYYQGRSHCEVLHSVSWISLFLIALLTHDGVVAYRYWHEHNQTSRSLWRRACIVFFSMATSFCLLMHLLDALQFHIGGGSILWREKDSYCSVRDDAKFLGDFIKKCGVEKVLVISKQWQPCILRNVRLPPCSGQRCLTEIFLVKQERVLIDSIQGLTSHDAVIFSCATHDDYLKRHPELARLLAGYQRFEHGELIVFIPKRYPEVATFLSRCKEISSDEFRMYIPKPR